MERNIYQQLEIWKTSQRRKPLIINGARQVGKTHAIKHFGNTSFQKLAYFNFEKDTIAQDFFSQTLAPKKIIKLLELHAEITIEPGTTLIAFDEIQQCPRALNSLKYFYEEANEYHVVAAGSLLGVKTSQQEGFPVGKVNFINLYPLSFFEFLSATNHEQLRSFLEEYALIEPLPVPLHNKLIELLKYYFFIGGMPEAVAEYIKHENFISIREIHDEILTAYEKDFAKHAPTNDVMKITSVWHQVHRQLAKENKKFIFSALRKSARGRDYENAIQWLLDAGLIYKNHLVQHPKFPLSAYAHSPVFKVFLIDVGLLGAQSSLTLRSIIEGNKLFTECKGALTENFVAQELTASSTTKLYYWASPGSAEIDLLLQHDHEIYPLEVNTDENKKKKSLLSYDNKYDPSTLLRASLMNLKGHGKLINYPLYLVSRLCKQKYPY